MQKILDIDCITENIIITSNANVGLIKKIFYDHGTKKLGILWMFDSDLKPNKFNHIIGISAYERIFKKWYSFDIEMYRTSIIKKRLFLYHKLFNIGKAFNMVNKP